MDLIIIDVTVVNWEKFNPRSDRRNYQWFKVQNDLFNDEKVFQMSDPSKILLIFLLCECSKKSSESVKLNIPVTSVVLNKTPDEIVSILDELERLSVISRQLPGNVRQLPVNGRRLPNISPSRREEKRREERADARQEAAEETSLCLFEIWNTNCGELSKIVEATKKRRTEMKSRWEETPSKEYWENTVRRLAASQFCLGDNPRGWKATFDWLLKPDTHVKVSEGTYDATRKTPEPHLKVSTLADFDK